MMMERFLLYYPFSEGTGIKKCEKGVSCGATCIYSGDKCTSDLPENLKTPLRRVIEDLRTLGRRGALENEQVEKALSRLDESWSLSVAREISSAIQGINDAYGNPEEREKAIQEVLTQVIPAYTIRRDKTYKPTNEEMEAQRAGLEANRKYIEELDKIEERVKREKLAPEKVNSLLKEAKETRQERDLSESQLNLAWALLPKTERDYLLDRAGSPSEAARYAPGQGTMEVPKNGWGGKLSTLSPEERLARAKMGLKTYLDEGGRDMYSGVRYPLIRMEWEHTIAVKNAGKGAETGANTGWTLQTTNRSKSDGSPSSVFKVSKTKKSDDPEEFNKLKKEAATAKAEDGFSLLNSVLNSSGLISKDKSAIVAEYLSTVYGVPKTFISGNMTTGRASSRRTEWLKTPTGQKVALAVAERMKKLLSEGKTEEAESLANRLKQIHSRIVNSLEGKGTKVPGSAGSTEVKNSVLTSELGKGF